MNGSVGWGRSKERKETSLGWNNRYATLEDDMILSDSDDDKDRISVLF